MHVNSGTSKRCLALPDGLPGVASVDRGNGLAACTCLFTLVLALLRNTFLVEQPNSSVLFDTSRMQWLVGTLSDLGYPVWKQSFWMGGWGHEYPKRTKLWSNNMAVRVFTTDKLAKQMVKKPPTCKRYESKSGKKGYTATKHLKKTEPLGISHCSIDCRGITRPSLRQRSWRLCHPLHTSCGMFLWALRPLIYQIEIPLAGKAWPSLSAFRGSSMGWRCLD